MNHQLIIETCCGSADDVIQSEIAGADRAELNSALFLGGLTPSIGALEAAKESTHHIRIMTMVRPRHGGFCYTDADFQVMKKDARLLLEHGSDGIVFGFLTEDGCIDIERCKEMMDIIGDKESVFHRAIDVVPDWKTAMDTLIDLGITRILTSGQEKSALLGKERIRQMLQYANGRIEILPGAGIREHNAEELLEYTGCNQLHISKRKQCQDTSVRYNPQINFGNPAAPDEYAYEMIDGTGFRVTIDNLRPNK